jgi:Cytochrome C'
MSKWSHTVLPALTLTAVLLVSAGCGPASNTGQANVPPGGPPAGPGDSGGTPTNIKQVMSKIGKPPQNLTNAIGEGLKADPPAWDALQPQTKEYAQLTAALAKMDAPKGNKESWEKQTADYAASAAALDAAIQNKDRDGAKAAHTKLTNSCAACHKEFRGGRPG